MTPDALILLLFTFGLFLLLVVIVLIINLLLNNLRKHEYKSFSQYFTLKEAIENISLKLNKSQPSEEIKTRIISICPLYTAKSKAVSPLLFVSLISTPLLIKS